MYDVSRQIYNFYTEEGVSDIGFFVCLLPRMNENMTVPEATQLYEHIRESILETKLKDAFSGLGVLIQQNGFGKAYEKLTETENKYRYMLRYRLEGFPDPEFDTTQRTICRQLLELASEVYHNWMTRNSSNYYYDRIRVNRIGAMETLQELVEYLRQSGERLTLVELVENTQDRDVKKAQITRSRENTAGQIFYKIFVSELWSEDEYSYLKHVLLDPELFEHEKALFISALLLSLLIRFDERKILFLMEVCQNREAEVSQRAMVALVITLSKYDFQLYLYPEIALTLATMLETHPEWNESFVRIFYQLIRSKDTDQVTRRMQEEILPEMTKMGSVIQDKLKEGEDISDEFNPDWQNMMENSEFSIKMQQFSDMQLEGIDVYMSTFSTQKGYSFFLEFPNWFMPFHASHSSLHDLFKENPIEGKSVLNAVIGSDYLCSSDKYSFCFNLLQVPANYRSSMSSQMNADSEAYQEIRKSKMGMNSKYSLEQISNRYIQDLYRFFNLHNRRKDFLNPFTLSMDFLHSSIFEPFMQAELSLKRIAMLYFTNKHYDHALRVFERLLLLSPDDAELHQKCGYCLQQLNHPDLALSAYLQAELIRPESLWTLKRIANLYRILHQPQKALVFYQKASLLAPNDLIIIMNTGHAHLDSKNYIDALNVYFKAELMTDGSDKTWRPIAWCSFMCRKYEQAEKYYRFILEKTPTIEDYLNAGHVEWCKGSPMKAVEMYKRGIRLTHTILPDFLELFRKDVDELQRHGISRIEISVLRDELMYELEE
jgi:tetratricopeptide (TPR) repeat protein